MIEYSFTKQADEELRRLPLSTQKLIIKKIKHYCSSHDPLHFADAIEGEKGKIYRYRIGDYRAIFDWEKSHILVTRIGKRSEVYRK